MLEKFIHDNLHHYKNNGLIEKLILSLTPQTEPLKNFMLQWLMGIGAGVRGHKWGGYMLVLVGPPAIGKSYFFKYLFPIELYGYCEETRIENTKDIYVLMTEALLIVDNELQFKYDFQLSKLKEMLTKDTIVLRYPYTSEIQHKRRIAQFAATSNDADLFHKDALNGQRRIFLYNVNYIDHALYNSIDKTALFMEILYRYDHV